MINRISIIAVKDRVPPHLWEPKSTGLTAEQLHTAEMAAKVELDRGLDVPLDNVVKAALATIGSSRLHPEQASAVLRVVANTVAPGSFSVNNLDSENYPHFVLSTAESLDSALGLLERQKTNRNFSSIAANEIIDLLYNDLDYLTRGLDLGNFIDRRTFDGRCKEYFGTAINLTPTTKSTPASSSTPTYKNTLGNIERILKTKVSGDKGAFKEWFIKSFCNLPEMYALANCI